MTVEDDVATKLAARFTALGVTGWTKGGNIRQGFMADEAAAGSTATNKVPGLCIFCIPTGGVATEAWKRSASGADSDGYPTAVEGLQMRSVELLVRSARNGYAAGRTASDDAHRAMDGFPPSGYQECRAGPPAFLRKDEDDHFLFSVNLRLVKQL